MASWPRRRRDGRRTYTAAARRDFGLAMLFITHDLELAAAICDRTVVM